MNHVRHIMMAVMIIFTGQYESCSLYRDESNDNIYRLI